MKYVAAFFIAVVFFLHAAEAQNEFSVGVSPPITDGGEIQRGTQKVVSFSITTLSSDPLTINMEKSRGTIDFFSGSNSYAVYASNYSDQNAFGWVNIFDNPVEINPSGELQAGSATIRGSRQISLSINVPADAEPGYHVVSIRPLPRVAGGEIGAAGARVIAVTSESIVFSVPGEAVRKGVILDTTIAAYSDSGLTLDVHFQNTGTVTLYAQASIDLYDSYGNFVGTAQTERHYVVPNQIQVFRGIAEASTPPGEYSAVSTVSFTTGKAVKNSTLATKMEAGTIFIPKAEAQPITPIIIIILIISAAIVMYRKVF